MYFLWVHFWFVWLQNLTNAFRQHDTNQTGVITIGYEQYLHLVMNSRIWIILTDKGHGDEFFLLYLWIWLTWLLQMLDDESDSFALQYNSIKEMLRNSCIFHGVYKRSKCEPNCKKKKKNKKKSHHLRMYNRLTIQFSTEIVEWD